MKWITEMRALIIAAAVAIATPAFAKSPKITPEQTALYRMFMEAKIAVKFCPADHFEVNETSFDKAFSGVRTLSDKDGGEIFVATLIHHEKALKSDPEKWCGEYKKFLTDSYAWSDDAPAHFDGFGK